MTVDPIAKKALNLLRQIKSVTFATLNRGEPAARIIDVMLVEEDGLYFLTARGKAFYEQLKTNPKIAICGMDQNYVTARIIGDIQFCNSKSIIDKIFVFAFSKIARVEITIHPLECLFQFHQKFD
jgi:uncharacterized pyridoxamine 5'-phosphate oxidase family protein